MQVLWSILVLRVCLLFNFTREFIEQKLNRKNTRTHRETALNALWSIKVLAAVDNDCRVPDSVKVLAQQHPWHHCGHSLSQVVDVQLHLLRSLVLHCGCGGSCCFKLCHSTITITHCNRDLLSGYLYNLINRHKHRFNVTCTKRSSPFCNVFAFVNLIHCAHSDLAVAIARDRCTWWWLAGWCGSWWCCDPGSDWLLCSTAAVAGHRK